MASPFGMVGTHNAVSCCVSNEGAPLGSLAQIRTTVDVISVKKREENDAKEVRQGGAHCSVKQMKAIVQRRKWDKRWREQAHRPTCGEQNMEGLEWET